MEFESSRQNSQLTTSSGFVSLLSQDLSLSQNSNFSQSYNQSLVPHTNYVSNQYLNHKRKRDLINNEVRCQIVNTSQLDAKQLKPTDSNFIIDPFDADARFENPEYNINSKPISEPETTTSNVQTIKVRIDACISTLYSVYALVEDNWKMEKNINKIIKNHVLYVGYGKSSVRPRQSANEYAKQLGRNNFSALYLFKNLSLQNAIQIESCILQYLLYKKKSAQIFPKVTNQNQNIILTAITENNKKVGKQLLKLGLDYALTNDFTTIVKLEVCENQNQPYQCNQCKREFSYNSHLKRHKQAVHGIDDEGHSCECGKTFSSRKRLKKHMKDINASKKPRFMNSLLTNEE